MFQTNSYSYVEDKFYIAIKYLATYDQELRKRLLNVYIYSLGLLKDQHIPPKYEKEWIWINDQYHRFPPPLNFNNDSKIEYSLSRTSEDDLQVLASKIFDLGMNLLVKG
jgi:hypothetical protein